MGMNVTEYARHRGVSHVAVVKALNNGRIEKEPDGTIDPAKADAAWQNNTNQAQRRHIQRITKPSTTVEASGGSGGPSYAQSRAIKEAYNARLAKLEYEEKSGVLVKSDSVKVAWFNVLRVLRDRVMNLPDRLSPILAAETDPKRVHELMNEELRQILTDAADAVATSNETPKE